MTRRLPLGTLLVANTVSAGGSAMTVLAVPWFVLQATGSALSTGIVAAAETVGLAVSAVLSGPVVNRRGAHRASVASDVVAAVAVAAVPVLHAVAALSLCGLALLAALMGLTRAPGSTARYVLLPDLAGQAEVPLDRATSWYDGVSRTAQTVGPPLAGLLVAVIGPPQVLLVDAGTFLLSALLIGPFCRGSGSPVPVGGSYLRELRTGVGFLRRDRLLLAIVAMVTVTNGLDAGWTTVVQPVYAREVLHSSVALGVLFAAAGAGSVLGAVLYGWRGMRLSRWLTYTICFAVCGVPRFVLFLVHPGLPVLVIGLAVFGLAAGTINPILIATVFRRCPSDMRAMVVSVIQAGVLAVMPVGTLLAGLGVQVTGLSATLVIGGGLYLLATVCPLVFPVWRQMDSEPAMATCAATPERAG
jgi:MFS family permease